MRYHYNSIFYTVHNLFPDSEKENNYRHDSSGTKKRGQSSASPTSSNDLTRSTNKINDLLTVDAPVSFNSTKRMRTRSALGSSESALLNSETELHDDSVTTLGKKNHE